MNSKGSRVTTRENGGWWGDHPRPSVARVVAAVFAGMAGLLLATLLAQAWLSWDTERSRGEAILRGTAALAADGLGRQLEGLRLAVAGLVRDRRVIPAKIPFQDPGAVLRLERSLVEQMPGALGVLLLPPGHSSLDETASPALGFAGLDLLRKAERSDSALPWEVHLVGTPGQHLATAVALRDPGGEVRAALRVAYPNTLPGFVPAPPGGRLALQQQVGGQWVSLDPASPTDARPTGAVEVPATTLRVAYWVDPPGLTEGLRKGGWVFLVFLAAGGWWLRRMAVRLSQNVRHDARAVMEFAASICRRGVGPSLRLRLAESQGVAEQWLADYQHTEPGDPARSGVEGLLVAPPSLGDGSALSPPVAVMGPAAESVDESAGEEHPPEEIFRAYDIRGVAGETLTTAHMRRLGRAIGSEARDQGRGAILVARDTRESSEGLTFALSEGLCASGLEVVDLGVVPTPILYFATRFLGTDAGVMITASHNPLEHNGLKVVLGGEALAGEALKGLRGRLLRGDLTAGSGRRREQNLTPDYLEAIERDLVLSRPVRVVVDCGGGTTRAVAPAALRRIGCSVSEIDCREVGFPRYLADPTQPDHLERLQDRVLAEGADLGVGFDEDGDRLGVVDSSGKIIWTDRLLMLLAQEVLARQPGSEILFDVKCSHRLAGVISESGGRPVMVKSGHSNLKAELRARGAPLGGEWSGHIAFADRWNGFDDATYAAARLCEILARDPRPSAAVFAALPEPFATPELELPMAEGEPGRLVARLMARLPDLGQTDIQAIDGIRLGFPHGWGLVRASNTRPALTFRFEGDTREDLLAVKKHFRGLLADVAPHLNPPF
jgi:phosphomannomutase / phosphoglucomutase